MDDLEGFKQKKNKTRLPFNLPEKTDKKWVNFLEEQQKKEAGMQTPQESRCHGGAH